MTSDSVSDDGVRDGGREVRPMRVIVVGASSGIGRSIALGLAAQGAHVALLARRLDRLKAAAEEAGEHAFPAACDVTDPDSCRTAVADAANALGGVDGLVFATAAWAVAPVEGTDADVWGRMFATNVTGASLVTAAALPHLAASGGAAVYLSSISASLGPPWAYLGAYVTSKAALDKLVEVWRIEHPEVGFTRLTIGDCLGGEGDSATGIADNADPEVFGRAITEWARLGYVTGNFVDVAHIVDAVSSVLRFGRTSSIPSMTVIPRIPATETEAN
ncbi:SDR family oxidoreductase [Yinghuangia sp. YIM S10712]|uniref:SDR family oxidoreductase n=1 Tax=Yinghuangia sp. YIM S10712 TaxID=3436930 RepID=UPI003F534DB1